MNNLIQRAITGVLFVAVLTVAILYAKWSLAWLFFFFTLVGLSEYYSILRKGNEKVPLPISGYLSATLIHGVSFLAWPEYPKYLAAWLIPIPIVIFIELFRNPKQALLRMSYAVLPILWIVIPFACLVMISEVLYEYTGKLVLGFFILLCINDTGAYLTGKSIGRTKLAPKISPGKTVEGYIGGIALSVLAAAFLHEILEILTRTDWMIMAAIIAVFSNAGDLVESVLKRHCGVKDSGNLLPGHGGVLDRFDGVFLSAPLILAYLLLQNS